MKKTITINGMKTKGNFDVIYEQQNQGERLPDSDKYTGIQKQLISLIIDGVIYKNSFTRFVQQSKKTGIVSYYHICNKTGQRFGDSFVKLTAYLLNTQKQ